jgi:hypothetical protein
MIILALILLLGTTWGLWNLYQKVKRLDTLIELWEETLTTIQDDHDVSTVGKPAGQEGSSNIRLILEITDAVSLAKKYHWAGGIGALAPAILKKTLQTKVLERTQAQIEEGGYDVDVKVIVL